MVAHSSCPSTGMCVVALSARNNKRLTKEGLVGFGLPSDVFVLNYILFCTPHIHSKLQRVAFIAGLLH